MHKIKITVSLIVTALLLLGACTPAAEIEQPAHEQLNFQLVSDATPGDTDAYDGYSFAIYLDEGQELALAFSAQGAALRVSLFTPSEETWGYNPSADVDTTTEDVELGHLTKGRIISAEEGSFRFTAPESGYYLATLQSASPTAEIDVQVEYQIQ
jgi:hypothetical protein